MLVFPNVCASCGCQVGSLALLYLWLRNDKYGGKRPDNYAETDYRDIAEAAGIVNPCCWQLVQGTLTHADLNLGVRLMISDGTVI
jgi:hypothetical protein